MLPISFSLDGGHLVHRPASDSSPVWYNTVEGWGNEFSAGAVSGFPRQPQQQFLQLQHVGTETKVLRLSGAEGIGEGQQLRNLHDANLARFTNGTSQSRCATIVMFRSNEGRRVRGE